MNSSFKIGDFVKVYGELCVVESISLPHISVKTFFGNKPYFVQHDKVSQLFNSVSENKAFEAYTEEEKQEAFQRFELIKPILQNPGDGGIVVEAAKKSGYSKASLYNWTKKFLEIGQVASLIPNSRADKGKNRLPSKIENVITDIIADEFHTKRRKKVSEIIESIQAKCFSLKIKAPHPNTIRNRINAYDLYTALKTRYSKRHARQEMGLNDGESPKATAPLQLAEVDHTQMDIILVDEITRIPLGRPWLTSLIDEYSRAVLGFYLSYQTPGYLGLGQCIAHSILPKEDWLESQKIERDRWPIYGLPQTIQCDNGKEMKSNALKATCLNYNINLEYRPVKKSHFGGHIERFGETVNTKVHSLEGATFSSIQEKGDLDPKKYACFSLTEFEQWLTNFIVNEYHHKKHQGIGMSPLHKYFKDIDGEVNLFNANGILPSNKNPLQVKIDFLPAISRTIHRRNIAYENIKYSSFELNAIKALAKIKDEDKKGKRKFIIKVDPRNLKYIFLLHPTLDTYITVPAKNLAMKSISLWEWKAASRDLHKKGIKTVKEEMVYKSVLKRREIAEEAARKTRKAKLQKLKPVKQSVTILSDNKDKQAQENIDHNITLDFNPNELPPFDVRR